MFVPPAQPHRRAGIGTCDELLRLAIGEGAALQLKAALGGGGEPVPIAGLGGAEKALGRDMQPDGLADGRREMARQPLGAGDRSEEHTSELQSLMRISYAVFCLKKKRKHSRTDVQLRQLTIPTSDYA